MQLKLVALLLAGLLQTPAYAQTPALAQEPGLEAARRVVATLQLAAREYRMAWVGDSLAATAEWEEAKLFVAEARRSADQLPVAARAELAVALDSAARKLDRRVAPDSLDAVAKLVERRLTALLGVSLDEQPAREPSYAGGERIYQASCAMCHGVSGRGDGELARAQRLDPPPANLADTALLAGVTPLELYRKITHGVPGTAMPAFGASLNREQRWDVVAYALTFSDPAARRGRSGQLAVVFGTVRGTLGSAMELAQRGERDAAASRVLDAYMAYETVEGSLQATEPTLVKRAEERFTALRASLATGASAGAREKARADVLLSLVEAENALTATHSSAGLFMESLLLMMREGFEAILVVGAIMAVLIKAGAKEKQRHVRIGVVLALVASLVTAALMELIFRVTPTQREALEGGIMLLAAAVLFYASYWLISKVEIAAWTRFVKGQIQRAVESGSGLAMASVAFLAVYREGFETVLFYKALYVTGANGGAAPITAGIVAGLAALVALFIAIERFGLKIPMRPFFAATGATLAFMAFVFAGDGVKELQEGSYLPSTLLGWAPRNDFFGVYPTLESLGVQMLILLALVFGLIWTFVVMPRRMATAGKGSITAPIERKGRQTTARKTSV